jgi:uncharacterized protein
VFIEIEDLKSEPLEVRHVYKAGEIQFWHEDARLNEPVSIDFVLKHSDKDLRIEGRVATSILFRCSRCGKEFSRPFSAGYDLFYRPQPVWSSERDEVELKYDDMEVAFYDGLRFDVDLMVLEQIELAMPMRFICSEECKGLCYICGADLNYGACLCKREETDSRLAALLEFRNRKMEK